MASEKTIETKCRMLHKYLKTDIRYDLNFLPRPFFVEITGTPDSGKSTIIEQLYNDLRKEKLKILRPQEGAQFIQDIERDTPLYNISTGLYSIDKLIHLSRGHQYDIVIFERCCFDMHVWMEDWSQLGKLNEDEKLMYQRFALSRFWIDNIDAAFFVVCDPAVSMERAMELSSTKKVGKTTNLEKVTALVEKYKTAFLCLARSHKQLELIDTTKLKKKEMVGLFTEKVLNALVNKTKNG